MAHPPFYIYARYIYIYPRSIYKICFISMELKTWSQNCTQIPGFVDGPPSIARHAFCLPFIVRHFVYWFVIHSILTICFASASCTVFNKIIVWFHRLVWFQSQLESFTSSSIIYISSALYSILYCKREITLATNERHLQLYGSMKNHMN